VISADGSGRTIPLAECRFAPNSGSLEIDRAFYFPSLPLLALSYARSRDLSSDI
jgi:hypothetical protein